MQGDEFLEFSVNSAYGLLRGEIKGESSRMFNLFWRIKALPSFHITSWKVLENKIASKVNLARRGVIVDSIVFLFLWDYRGVY